MKVRYVGPHTHVEIAATGQRVGRDETVEVPAEVGRSLVRQSVWEKPPRPRSSEQSNEKE